ncbi:MAG: M28 family peptidase [Negativicutes bacterium]
MLDLQNICSEIDENRITQDIRWLLENTPYRIAGGEDEKKAAAFVTDRMQTLGLEARVDSFRAFNSFPRFSKFEVISPVAFELDSLPCAHIRSTGHAGKEMELIYVGSGSYESYQNVDAKGKAVLVEVSYSPAVPEKARIAYEMGAEGIVCMNWGSGQDVICHRGLKGVWGNPTEDTLPHIPQLIGIGIAQGDGWKLKELCLSGQSVRVRIAAVSDPSWSEVHQPIGFLRGNGQYDEVIVVGSHLDAWKPGVTCNATGDATALELARVFASHREQLKRDIWFVFWTGHEIAEAAGSTWFVDHYWDVLQKKGVLYLNIDSTGMRDATLYEVKHSSELHDFARDTVKSVSDIELRMQKMTKIGDQSFFGIGIPSLAQRMSFTKEYMERNWGATLGWWNHTREDGFDKYDPANIALDTRLLSAVIYQTARVDMLPYQFDGKLAEIREKINDIAGQYGDRIDFDDLTANAELAERKVLEILKKRGQIAEESKIKLYNQYVMNATRLLTNVFQTCSDKYQQDSYGHSNLSYPVPLFADLRKLDVLDNQSMEYGMVETQIVKNKNRINDALHSLVQCSSLYDTVIFS